MHNGDGSAAEQAPQPAAAELLDEVHRVDAELRQQSGVLVGVDLRGEFLVGLLRLGVVALGTEELEDLVLVDLHGSCGTQRSRIAVSNRRLDDRPELPVRSGREPRPDGRTCPAGRPVTAPPQAGRTMSTQVEELLKPFPIKEFHPFPRATMGPVAPAGGRLPAHRCRCRGRRHRSAGHALRRARPDRGPVLPRDARTARRTWLACYRGDDGPLLPFLAVGAIGLVSMAGHLVQLTLALLGLIPTAAMRLPQAAAGEDEVRAGAAGLVTAGLLPATEG